MSSERYVCVHGHFYQPPRENPWLESIEVQDSAYPYHDWNQRITAECYAPNSRSRVLDDQGYIRRIVNNYARISFDVGPTLLAWLETAAPEVYEALIEADRQSAARFSGHGSALAQTYNHLILPLANSRDRRTQILWGIRDFEHRFGRAPEGMWLPEAAVDLESLELMAELGIRFTILAPHQAVRVRRTGEEAWTELGDQGIDSSRPYRLRLPSSRDIALFFYNGPISRSVAFEGLLASGEEFGRRLVGAFDGEREDSQLVHIATDGETYGHHHRFGDMALAYALDWIETQDLARLTNYGEYLEMHPPADEVEIREDTSWSCAHGVERWRSDCGCNTGANPRWNQSWRSPLRAALDWLRDELSPRYEEAAARLLRDPWRARDDYIWVILDRSAGHLERFFKRHARQGLDDNERATAIKLLELQRHAMLMYTSCGWFFDELTGIETIQVLQYAGRAVQLTQELFGDTIEERFLERLAEAKSNRPEVGDGSEMYARFVKPAIVDLPKVAAHFAISSLFDGAAEGGIMYCYDVQIAEYEKSRIGQSSVALGTARFTSRITLESELLTFGAVHLGNHNVECGVRASRGEEAYTGLKKAVARAFAIADLPGLVRLFDREFRGAAYSLRTLFRDEQRRVLDVILGSTLEEADTAYRQLYDHHATLLRFLVDLKSPVPQPIHAAAQMALSGLLRAALRAELPDVERAKGLLTEAETAGVALDADGLAYTLEQTITRLARRFAEEPLEAATLSDLGEILDLAAAAPFEVNLWQAQNACWQVRQELFATMRERAERGDEGALAWVGRFRRLGERLRMRVDG